MTDPNTYAQYGPAMTLLMQLSTQIMGLPLEDLELCANRILLTGTYNGPAGSEPVAPQLAEGHRMVLAAAKHYRDRCRAAEQLLAIGSQATAQARAQQEALAARAVASVGRPA